MRTMKISYFGPLSFSMLFLVSMVSTPALHAQAPAAGASVAVRMIDAIDSSKDLAGKQYRASVTQAVDAGNGVTIPQGAAALVTLVNGGSGWTTQLVSVTVNGQPVAVSSSPANVTSGAQNMASSAVSAVGSMLSGFGHHVKPPTGVTAVAMGQRVVLPPGATLTFVLTQPPAATASAASGAPAPPSSQPMIASAASPPAPPASSVAAAAPGQNWWMCSFRDVKDPYKPALGSRMYYALVPSSDATANGPGRLGIHFTGYVRQNYKVTDNATAGAVGYGGCKRFSNDPASRANSLDMSLKQWASSNIESIPVNWTNTPAENAAIDAKLAGAASVAATASATLTAAPNQTYAWCSSEWAGTAGTLMPVGTVMYFSDVFPITPPPQPSGKTGNGSAQIAAQSLASIPFSGFLQKTYGYKSGVRCAVTYPPTLAGMQDAQKYKQQFEDMARHNNGQVIETGWKNQ